MGRDRKQPAQTTVTVVSGPKGKRLIRNADRPNRKAWAKNSPRVSGGPTPPGRRMEPAERAWHEAKVSITLGNSLGVRY